MPPIEIATEALAPSAGTLLVKTSEALPFTSVRTTDEPVAPDTGVTSPAAAAVHVVVNVTG